VVPDSDANRVPKIVDGLREYLSSKLQSEERHEMAGLFNCMFNLEDIVLSIIEAGKAGESPRVVIQAWLKSINDQATNLIEYTNGATKSHEVGFCTAEVFKRAQLGDSGAQAELTKRPSKFEMLMARINGSEVAPVMFFASQRWIYGLDGLRLGPLIPGIYPESRSEERVTLARANPSVGKGSAIRVGKDVPLREAHAGVLALRFDQSFMLYNVRSSNSNWGFYDAMGTSYSNAFSSPSLDGERGFILVSHTVVGYKRPVSASELTTVSAYKAEDWDVNPSREYANSDNGMMLTPKVRMTVYRMSKGVAVESVLLARLVDAHQTIINNMKYLSFMHKGRDPLVEPLKDVVLDLPSVLCETLAMISPAEERVALFEASVSYQSVTYNRSEPSNYMDHYNKMRESFKAIRELLSHHLANDVPLAHDVVRTYCRNVVTNYSILVSMLSLNVSTHHNRRPLMEFPLEKWESKFIYAKGSGPIRSQDASVMFRRAFDHFARDSINQIIQNKDIISERASTDVALGGVGSFNTLFHASIPLLLYGDSQLQKAYRNL
jgi:hypothetical protein